MADEARAGGIGRIGAEAAPRAPDGLAWSSERWRALDVVDLRLPLDWPLSGAEGWPERDILPSMWWGSAEGVRSIGGAGGTQLAAWLPAVEE